ncbi:phosphomannomutase [Rhizobium sp. AQ_MP]|uniref:phosphomannomutase n=1 Tax=Rhizobium sp. AQ_MP TaxID=2761536 RepID=UPI00163B11E6|nr:phosphomannomutase [Rhizobium sp. AQ_MP]MBC2775803.1 phosphomannomutase [Rhizobium sp. AQ_MP]
MKFGTSGLRGLVSDLLGPDTARYAMAFGGYLLSTKQARLGSKIYVGGDLRLSTPQIMVTCMNALEKVGLSPVDCGFLPTPALALHAMSNKAACLMVTGSHIPADRNGIKFYTPHGEITKADEGAITALALDRLTEVQDISPARRFDVEQDAELLFLERNKMLLPEKALTKLRIGVYQHSTVARDTLVSVLKYHGADVIPLGRSNEFIPVDTEAVPESLVKLFKHWADMHHLDAIVSADGDGDRPLVTDENGDVVRGDALGVLVARFLSADVVATPVTSSSGVETSGRYRVIRTKVGSPYVIEGMAGACEASSHSVMGFEANGGVLLASTIDCIGRVLQPLPTRDSFLPILVALHTAASQRKRLSLVVSALKLPVALSDRIESFPIEESAALMTRLRAGPDQLAEFLEPIGRITHVSDVDGLRITVNAGEVVHIRPSGNAPEMRCCVEAENRGRAEALLLRVMELIAAARAR